MPKKRRATNPKPERKIEIKAVRRAEIDADMLAKVYFDEGLRRSRERREAGLLPAELSPEQLARLKQSDPKTYELWQKLKKAQRRREARIELAAPESPQQPETDQPGQLAP